MLGGMEHLRWEQPKLRGCLGEFIINYEPIRILI